MEERVEKYLNLLVNRYPTLEECKEDVLKAYEILEECYKNGNKLLIAGNGGSCADSQHIVGELMKGFKHPRKCSKEFAEKLIKADAVRGAELAERLQGGLPAIALTEHQALNTAYINDVANGGLLTYAQQVYGYGKAGDVLLGISTSGNSKNVMNAVTVAKALGIKVIGLTGAKGGELASSADVAIKVPETETYMIQELHLPVYHCLCLMLEEKFFG
ncbi:MAG: SIS domain-containing protein [Clostridia bacterium]|nr:SIS domain-containing protein [Clostridia bacterium]